MRYRNQNSLKNNVLSMYVLTNIHLYDMYADNIVVCHEKSYSEVSDAEEDLVLMTIYEKIHP